MEKLFGVVSSEQSQVVRCLKPSDFGDVIIAQLHHFSDACEDSYGSVTYLHLQNVHLQVHSVHIMGTSRVAPLKEMMVLRMGLTAITMVSCMDYIWKQELHMEFQETWLSRLLSSTT